MKILLEFVEDVRDKLMELNVKEIFIDFIILLFILIFN